MDSIRLTRRAAAGPLDDESVAALLRLFDDGRHVAQGARADALVRTLLDALTAAFITGGEAAWSRVYAALQYIEASADDRSTPARVRVRAFLAENADLALGNHDWQTSSTGEDWAYAVPQT